MDGMTGEHKTHDLSHGETHKKNGTRAHSSVRVDVLNVEVSVGGHVVIGVRDRNRATTPHGILTFCPIFLSNCELVVRLYDLIVTSSCSHLMHTFAPRKHVI